MFPTVPMTQAPKVDHEELGSSSLCSDTCQVGGRVPGNQLMRINCSAGSQRAVAAGGTGRRASYGVACSTGVGKDSTGVATPDPTSA